MPALVVDTDVISYVFKRDTRARLYEPHLADVTLIFSFQTLAELERWALEHRWGQDRRRRLRQFLEPFILQPFDRELCRVWAEVCVAARRSGRPIETADAWVAATALHLGIPLVTNNPGDYAGISSLTILSETAT